MRRIHNYKLIKNVVLEKPCSSKDYNIFSSIDSAYVSRPSRRKTFHTSSKYLIENKENKFKNNNLFRPSNSHKILSNHTPAHSDVSIVIHKKSVVDKPLSKKTLPFSWRKQLRENSILDTFQYRSRLYDRQLIAMRPQLKIYSRNQKSSQ